MRRWQRLGVRGRLTAFSTVVVLVAVVLGGTLLVGLLRSELAATASGDARARVADVAALVQAGGVDAVGPALVQGTPAGQYAQLVGPDGTVRAASEQRVADRPLSRQRPAPGVTQSVRLDTHDLGRTDDWVVAARGVSVDGQAYVVQAAVPAAAQRQAVAAVAALVAVAAPVLVLLVAGATWVLVGRALRPVEQLRAVVATIDAPRLHERVAVPPSADEIAALARTMNTMLERLERSDRTQRTFVSDASHELRSPLAALTSATEIAAGADEPARTMLLAGMAPELARMRALIDDLTTLARADAHQLLGAPGEVDLDDVVDVELRRHRDAAAHPVQVQFEPVRITGDARRLAQVVRNLLANADRHARGVVRLTLTAGDGTAELTVDNDGDVVPVADRERVFDRFVRLDDARTRAEGGSGLGLAICRQVVQAHGGTIVATEAPDGWCRFSVALPGGADATRSPSGS